MTRKQHTGDIGNTRSKSNAHLYTTLNYWYIRADLSPRTVSLVTYPSTACEHSVDLTLFLLKYTLSDILEYFLEKDDPSIQTVADFLRVYQEPYKVTLTNGKYLIYI